MIFGESTEAFAARKQAACGGAGALAPAEGAAVTVVPGDGEARGPCVLTEACRRCAGCGACFAFALLGPRGWWCALRMDFAAAAEEPWCFGPVLPPALAAGVAALSKTI